MKKVKRSYMKYMKTPKEIRIKNILYFVQIAMDSRNC